MRMARLMLLFALTAPSVCVGQRGAYQDAVLVRFESVRTGTNCQTNGSSRGEVDGDTVSTNGSASTSCSDAFYRHYTVKIGDSSYVLEHAASKKSKGIGLATLGWSHAFERQSVLANLLPGTHLQVRTDGDGFHVKVGKRESLFAVVAAQ